MSTTTLNNIDAPSTSDVPKGFTVNRTTGNLETKAHAALHINARFLSIRRDTAKVITGEIPKAYFASLHGFTPKCVLKGGRHSRE